MITLSDSILLASAKLRAHKVRTVFTVLLASLLFGVLVAASLVTTGAFKSIDTFRHGGLTSRYIVNVYNAPGDLTSLGKTLRDPTLIAEAKSRYENLVKEKTAEAKRLNIDYTQASDQPPYALDSNNEERLTPNDPNGIVYGLLKEKYSHEPAFDDTKLQMVAKKYSAKNIFATTNDTLGHNATLTVGKEVFYDETDTAALNANYQPPIVDGLQMALTPSDITTPFLLKNNAGWKPSDRNLPIILPQNRIERLLGLEQLPETATTSQKSDRLEAVRAKASDLTFKACYRNGASRTLIQQTLQQQKDIKAGEGKKDYQKPPRIYSLPDATSCSEPTVASDTRSIDEKKHDANQALFDEKFGNTESPKSYFVSFKLVGISPAESIQTARPDQQADDSQIRSAKDIITTLLQTNGIGQAIPLNLYDQMSNKSEYTDLFTYTPNYLFGNEDNKQRYVEFASARDAQKFIDEQSCTVSYDNVCKPVGRPYQATLGFSNSAAIDDLKAKASQWFNYGMVGVIVLAAIIMWITIGRTIADGRHETAVFRAIGFKRIDIALVYILYSVTLSLMVIVSASALGVAGAYYVDKHYAPGLTVEAQYDFGDLDRTKQVRLLGSDVDQLELLFVACLATGLLSVIFPLLRNIRRSPIRDMREE